MKKTALLAACAALITTPAFAGDWGSAPATTGFSYDFIDADWIYQGFDDELEDGNGWSIAGSKSITDDIFVAASYMQIDTEIFGLDVDIDRITIGPGYRMSATDRIDVVLQAAAVYTDVGVEGLPEELDEWGYSAGAGLRIQMTDNLEIFTNANWVDSLNDGQVEATVGAILMLTDQLGVRVGGRFVDDSNQLFVGGRFYY